MRKYTEVNKDRIRAKSASWKKQNPEQVKVQIHTRRARKVASGGTYSCEEWEALKAKYGNKCLRCGTPEAEELLTVDHVIPISLGGSSSIDNLQPLCKACNCSKHTARTDYRTGFGDDAFVESYAA